MDENLLREILDELHKLNMQTKKVYTAEDLADLMHTYVDKVNAWRRAGLITGIKKGRGYIYTSEEVDRFLKSNTGKELPN